MALSKIQRNMLASGSVLPENLITTATYTVAGLTATGIVTATTVNATTLNVTTVNATTLAASGNATAVHITASGNIVAAAVRATTVTATTAIVTNGTITTLSNTNLNTTNLTATNISTTNLNITGGSGFKVAGVRSNTATTIAYYNSGTGEITYGALSGIIPASYDQSLNTTDVVRFAGVTATSITVGGVQQTSAWTGTVASSQITSVSTSKVSGLSTIGFTGKLSDATGSISTSSITGLSTVGYTNQYADLTGKPSLATVATSGSYNDLSNKPTSWSTSSITGLSTVGYTNKYDDLTGKPSNQSLFTTSTVTFRTLVLPGLGGSYPQPATYESSGTVLMGGNLYIAGDIRDEDGILHLEGTPSVSIKSDLVTWKDLTPLYNNYSDIGSSSYRYKKIWSGDGDFTGTIYTDNLLPKNGGSTWSAADGDIGNTTRRWKNLWVQTINAQSTFTGGSIVADSISFTGDTDGRIQTTAWTGTVVASAVTGLATVATSGSYNDLSNKPTSWSTSSITGLSTVGYTNNYNDLTNKPNQSLNTSSFVTFDTLTANSGITVNGGGLTINGGNLIAGTAQLTTLTVNGNQQNYGMTNVQGLFATTGTLISKALSVGGYPLNSAGTFSYVISTGASPVAMFSNYNSGMLPQLALRGYGQNNPGGTTGTNPGVAIRLQAAYGTPGTPLAMPASQTIGGIFADGFDGRNFSSDYGAVPNFFGWFSTEAFTNDGSTTTYQAGSGFNIYSQPQWTRPGVNASRMRWLFQNWTTATGGPTQANIFIGTGVANDGAPTNTMVDGTTYTGWGKTNLTFVNAGTNFYGVTATDAAPDNAALTNTNFINLVGNRKNGSQTRRNALSVGDNLYIINFRGQNNFSQSGAGVVGASITTTALDTFTSTQYGTSMSIATVNTGTTTSRNRLVLSDRLMQLSADQYQFNSGNYGRIPLAFTTSTWNSSIDSYSFGNTAGTVTALSLTTASGVFSGSVTVGGNGVTFPDASTQNTAWVPNYGSFYDTTAAQTAANTTNLNVVTIGSQTTASGVTLTGNGAQVLNPGVYNIQLSIQLENSDTAAEDVVIWLRQNSTDLSNSAGVVTVPAKHGSVNGKIVSSWNYVLTAAAGDTFYLMWQPQATTCYIATQSAGTGTPSAPGVIFTVVRER